MKKAKKFFLNIFILVTAAAVVFYFGWMQFRVSQGTYVVMTSKTSGINEQVLRYGEFVWKWQNLLPTNVTLIPFSEKSYAVVYTEKGSLPSAELYCAQVDGPADFTYNISMEVSSVIDENEVLSLVKEGKVHSQEELDSFMKERNLMFAKHVAEYLVRNGSSKYFGQSFILSGTEATELSGKFGNNFRGISFSMVKVNNAKLPDMDVYERARQSFNVFQDGVDKELNVIAKDFADSLFDDDRTMKQLEEFAKLMEKYPQFSELSKSGNLIPVMEKLKSMSNK